MGKKINLSDKAKTLREAIEERLRTEENITDEQRKRREEFIEILMEKGDLFSATAEYIRRHGKEAEEAIDKWAEEMIAKGEKKEDVEKAKKMFKALAEFMKETL